MRDNRLALMRYSQPIKLYKKPSSTGEYVDGVWIPSEPKQYNVRLAILLPSQKLQYDDAGRWVMGDMLVIIPATFRLANGLQVSAEEKDEIEDPKTKLRYSLEDLSPPFGGVIRGRASLIKQQR